MAANLDVTRVLARLLGPFIGILGLSILLHNQMMADVVDAFAAQTALIFVTGAFVLLFGGAIVVLHNRWGSALQIAVSVIGWVSALRGAALLLAPRLVVDLARQFAAMPALMMAAGGVAFAFGLWLTVSAFRPSPPSPPRSSP